MTLGMVAREKGKKTEARIADHLEKERISEARANKMEEFTREEIDPGEIEERP